MLRERAQSYRWDDVADSYEELCRRLVTGPASPRPSGRRRRPGTRGAASQLPDDPHVVATA